MVSALYAVIGTLFILKFSFDVIRLRRQYRVSTGDGGFSELRLAIRVQGNSIEYIPISLILLLLAEMNGAEIWILHALAVLFFIGRALHARGLRHSILFWRRNGMMMTLAAIIAMLVVNLVYLPWELVLSVH